MMKPPLPDEDKAIKALTMINGFVLVITAAIEKKKALPIVLLDNFLNTIMPLFPVVGEILERSKHPLIKLTSRPSVRFEFARSVFEMSVTILEHLPMAFAEADLDKRKTALSLYVSNIFKYSARLLIYVEDKPALFKAHIQYMLRAVTPLQFLFSLKSLRSVNLALKLSKPIVKQARTLYNNLYVQNDHPSKEARTALFKLLGIEEMFHSLRAHHAALTRNMRHAKKYAASAERAIDSMKQFMETGAYLTNAYVHMGNYYLDQKDYTYALHWLTRAKDILIAHQDFFKLDHRDKIANCNALILSCERHKALRLFHNIKYLFSQNSPRFNFAFNKDTLFVSFVCTDSDTKSKLDVCLRQIRLNAISEQLICTIDLRDTSFYQWDRLSGALERTLQQPTLPIEKVPTIPERQGNDAAQPHQRSLNTAPNHTSIASLSLFKELPLADVCNPEETSEPPKIELIKWQSPQLPETTLPLQEELGEYELFRDIKRHRDILQLPIEALDALEKWQLDKKVKTLAERGTCLTGTGKNQMGFLFFSEEKKAKHYQHKFGEHCVGKVKWLGKGGKIRLGLFEQAKGILFRNDEATDITCTRYIASQIIKKH
jgi:hypothetical protein